MRETTVSNDDEFWHALCKHFICVINNTIRLKCYIDRVVPIFFLSRNQIKILKNKLKNYTTIHLQIHTENIVKQCI